MAMAIVPPGGVYITALETRLKNTCRRSCGSVLTGGMSASPAMESRWPRSWMSGLISSSTLRVSTPIPMSCSARVSLPPSSPGHVEQVVDAPDQALGGVPGILDEGRCVGEQRGLLRGQLEHPLDPGERGAELMRDERHEVRLHLTDPALAGDVPKGQRGPTVSPVALRVRPRHPAENDPARWQAEIALRIAPRSSTTARRAVTTASQSAVSQPPAISSASSRPITRSGSKPRSSAGRVHRLDPRLGDQDDGVRRGGEDLGDARLLGPGVFVVARIVQGDGRVVGERREELHFLRREVMGREEVVDVNAQDLPADDDGHGEERTWRDSLTSAPTAGL